MNSEPGNRRRKRRSTDPVDSRITGRRKKEAGGRGERRLSAERAGRRRCLGTRDVGIGQRGNRKQFDECDHEAGSEEVKEKQR